MREVIILAGGQGTRLKSITKNIPKCLVKVNEKEFLSYVLKSLENYNYDKIILALGYGQNQIRKFIDLNYSHLNVIYSIENKPLLTGGAVRLASEQIESDSFLILNADTFHNIDLDLLTNYHYSKNSDVTIALKPMNNFNRYGAVEFDKNNQVIKFREKENMSFGYINTGYIHVKKKVLLDFDIGVPFSFENNFLKEYVDKIKILSFIDDSYFIDIGVPEDYKKANEDFKILFN